MGQQLSRLQLCTLVLATHVNAGVQQRNSGGEIEHGPGGRPGHGGPSDERGGWHGGGHSGGNSGQWPGHGGIGHPGHGNGPPGHGNGSPGHGNGSPGYGNRPPGHGWKPHRPTFPWPSPSPSPSPSKQLQDWYENTVSDCGTLNDPSFLCSGIMLRATDSRLAFFPWDPSPRQINLGSTSFSWLRKDQTFARVLGNNGFILYPKKNVPDGKDKPINVLCSFPVDAFSHGRTQHGCGVLPSYPNVTETCQKLGVTTPKEWIEKYANVIYQVCGWSLGEGISHPAIPFDTCVQAHQALPDAVQEWRIYNELVLEVWAQGLGPKLPIHSFFHVGDDPFGLIGAQSDQLRYYHNYAQVVPIIQLTLPVKKGDDAEFVYDVRDQGVGKPNRNINVQLEDVAVGKHDNFTSSGIFFVLTGDGQIQDGPLPPGNASDDQLPSQLVSGHYITTNATISFGVPGYGPRNVTFSWGCRSACLFAEKIADNNTLIYADSEGTDQLEYGRTTFEVIAPEYIELTSSGPPDRIEMVIDNIVIV